MNIKRALQKFTTKVFLKLKASYNLIVAIGKESISQHKYRVISIEKDEDEFYQIEVQLINKNYTFKISPEEILANNEMTDAFSQRDIRTLTYLGYLGIHGPQYHILAKRLSENDNKFLFAIRRRGSNTTLIKTANEIAADNALINGLPQEDVHLVGYTVGTEQILNEKKQKKAALMEIVNKNSSMRI